MSTVQNYNTMFFGIQSPYHKIRTDANITESLSFILRNLSSKVFRERSFKAYMLANDIFRDGNTGINQPIKDAIGTLFDPLIENNGAATKDQGAFNALKKTAFTACETRITNEIKKATGIKNSSVMIIETGVDSFYNQKGISVFLTRNYYTPLEKCELEVKWESKFFKFNNPESLSLMIAVPKSYLFYLVFSVQSSITKDIRDNKLPYSKMKELMINAFTADLMRAFFVSIYNDGYLMRINRDIAAIEKILNTKGESFIKTHDIEMSEYTERNEKQRASELESYIKMIPGFAENLKSNSENLIVQLMALISYQTSITINPIEFYKGFVDIPYSQMEKMFNTISVFKRLDTFARTFDVDVSNSMNRLGDFINGADDSRQAPFLALRLVRFLPFAFFNAYILNDGNLNLQTKSFMLSINGFLSSLRSSKANGINFVHIDYINSLQSQLEKMADQANGLSKTFANPLKVNTYSTHKMKEAILAVSKSNINPSVLPVNP